MKKWHPDKYQQEDDIIMATERSRKINNAYEILTEYIDESGPIDRSSQESFSSVSSSPKHTYEGYSFSPGFPDETVFEVFVKSSHITSTGYKPHKRKMFIKFGNVVYEYSEVPIEIWDDFLEADSHGTFAHRVIYQRFSYRKCSEANKPYKTKFTMLVD